MTRTAIIRPASISGLTSTNLAGWNTASWPVKWSSLSETPPKVRTNQ